MTEIIPLAINNIVNKTSKINDYKVVSEKILGIGSPTNILILFQNNAEARPGGGFIGTVGYVTVENGKIKPQPVRSVYYYDYEVSKIRQSLKEEGTDISAIDYTIRDSGQSLDWPTNAKAANKLFELQPGKKVDIVIGLTPEVLKSLLKTTGPVRLENYNLEISADNIIATLQQEVESGQDKVEGKDPKTILSELANQLIARFSEKTTGELVQMSPQIQDLLQRRQITIFAKDYQVSNSLSKLGFDGSLIKNDGDYFLLTENNNSVDKSNAFINRKLGRKISINEEGRVVVELNITRTQTVGESFPYVDPKAPDVQTFLVKKNISQMKFAVPAGSKILGVSENFSIVPVGKEGGYDVYSFMSSLEPLVPASYQISYELPFRLAGANAASFDTYLQYQNGGWPYELSQTVSVPENWVLGASNRNDVLSRGSEVMYNGLIDKDFYWSLIYAKD